MTMRRFLWISSAVAAFLYFVLALALVLLTSQLHKMTRLHAESVESISSALNLEVALAEHNRNGNLFVSTRNPIFLSAQKRFERSIVGYLSSSKKYVGSEAEQMLDQEVEEAIEYYLGAWAAAENGDPQRPFSSRNIDLGFDAASSAIGKLVDMNRNQAEISQEQARMWDETANALGLGLFFLFGGGLVVLWVSLKRQLYSPLLAMNDTIRAYRFDADVRVREVGLEEIRLIGNEFNKTAEALRESKEKQFQFLAGVAHDLRNPLTALKGYLYLLNSRPKLPPEGELRTTLRLLGRQTDNLDRMIQDFLDASRIEAGELEMRFECMDLRNLLLETVEFHRQTVTHHTLTVEVGEGDYSILGDPLRIAQVLNNLVNNAIKYSPRGGLVKVGLSAYEDKMAVSVEDEGIGIQPVELEALFQPFHRAANAQSIPGVGLGLSTSLKIVRAHRGEIRVENKTGKGTRFIIQLPRNPASEREIPAHQKSRVLESESSASRNRFQD